MKKKSRLIRSNGKAQTGLCFGAQIKTAANTGGRRTGSG